MQPVLLVLQFLLAIALIAIILIQRTSQDGGGIMGGGGSTMGGLFTARGSANLLTKTTAVLATLFILNSLALGYIASREHREQGHSMTDQIAPVTPPQPAAPAPAPEAPQAPKAPEVPLAH